MSLESNSILLTELLELANSMPEGINTSDATISSKEVMKNEIAYGKDGKVVGSAPWSYVVASDSYKLEDFTDGVDVIATGCSERHLVVDSTNSIIRFDDEAFLNAEDYEF